MGAWGPAIFSNDITCDVRDSYIERLAVGMSDEDAEQQTIDEYQDELPEKWIALAVTEWKKGRLTENVKTNAIAAIGEELSCLDNWKASMQAKRKRALLAAVDMLHSAMPPRRKVGMPSWAWKCPWSVGDVLRYKILYPGAEFEAFIGKYVLFQVVKISETPPNKVPCQTHRIALYNWISDTPPTEESIKELFKFEFVTFCSRTGNTRQSHCVAFYPWEQRTHDILCIGHEPIDKFDRFVTEDLSVMTPGNTDDEAVCRGLMAHMESV